MAVLYFSLREAARFIAPAFIAPGAGGGAVNASILTEKLNVPCCCTPSVNSTLIESNGSIGVAVVMIMTVELRPPPFGCAGNVSTCVPLMGTSIPFVSVTLKSAGEDEMTRRSACPLPAPGLPKVVMPTMRKRSAVTFADKALFGRGREN